MLALLMFVFNLIFTRKFVICCAGRAANTALKVSVYTSVVQLLCSLNGWLHLNFSSICTGFNGTKTNCRIAHNLGILLMNSNCFAVIFSRILVMFV